MNSISWFLYLAEVAGNLIGLLALVAVVSFIGILGCLAAFTICRADAYNDEKEEWGRLQVKALKWLALPITCAILSVVIPSKTTLYLIAASETGEVALETPEFQKIRAVVNKYLDDALVEGNEADE